MIGLATILDALATAHLFTARQGRRFEIEQDLEIAEVTADSRLVGSHSLFVAVRGDTFDGHNFLSNAVERGAMAAIGSYGRHELVARGIELPPAFPYVQVRDSRRALAVCCAALDGFPSRDLVVIGVTGTDGKTTTCALIESILNVATQSAVSMPGRVGVITTVAARIRGRESDTGFHVTTPDAPQVQRFLAQMCTEGCRYAVVESTSHGLDQERVAAVDFDVAAVTNITHEHLDYHGTREAYIQAKAKLFRALYASAQKPGVKRCAVLNADDTGSVSVLRAVLAEESVRHGFAVPVRCYGINAMPDGHPPDVTASDIVFNPQSTRFTVTWWNGSFPLQTDLIGEFNVYNILCAVTTALALDLKPAQIQAGIAKMHGVLGRMERINRGQPFLAVVDFAHSPASLERALTTLRPLVGQAGAPRQGRLIAVFGCAGLRDREKRRLMGRVSGRLADFTVITAEDPRTEDLDEINRAIAMGVRDSADDTAFTVVNDRSAAIQFAVDIAEPGDVVAAFGKGHEQSMCFGTVEYPWSDQQAMTAALDKRTAHD